MPNTLTGLVFRLIQGTPLSDVQGDQNLTLIQNFVNGLAQIISISLNPDGTLAAGALNSTAQIANAPSIADFLAGSETAPNGTLLGANYTVINLAITAYSVGMRLRFGAVQTNSGNDTVQVSTVIGGVITLLPVVTITKAVNVPLVAGDILAGQAVELIYDGTHFQITQMKGLVATNAQILTGTDNIAPVTSLGLQVFKGFASTAFVLNQSSVIINVPHGLGVVPSKVRGVLVCNFAGGDAGYGQGQEVDVNQFSVLRSVTAVPSWQPCFTTYVDISNVYMVESQITGATLVGISVNHATTGTSTTITPGYWLAKIYASV